MWHAIGRTALAQLQSLLRGFLQDCSFPFGSVLTVQDLVALISEACVETGERNCTPLVTLCTFLSQIHSDDPSCRRRSRASMPCGWRKGCDQVRRALVATARRANGSRSRCYHGCWR